MNCFKLADLKKKKKKSVFKLTTNNEAIWLKINILSYTINTVILNLDNWNFKTNQEFLLSCQKSEITI